MKVKVWQKDMAVIGDFAKAIGCPTPLFTATEPIYDTAMETGHAMQDTAAVCAVMEKMAGVKRRNRKTAQVTQLALQKIQHRDLRHHRLRRVVALGGGERRGAREMRRR